jgi:hypothetical protein
MRIPELGKRYVALTNPHNTQVILEKVSKISYGDEFTRKGEIIKHTHVREYIKI